MNPSGSTNLICLLGSPVSHSISPDMHNTAFDALGLDYSYMAFDVKEENLKTAVEGLKTLGCMNFNLTMPLKTAIIPLLDEIDEAAKLSHSVNTCVNENGKLKVNILRMDVAVAVSLMHSHQKIRIKTAEDDSNLFVEWWTV